MSARRPGLRCLTLGALIFLAGCDTHCLSESDVLWPPGKAEFRLELTNRSGSMVDLRVNGESVGVFCDGVEALAVGNFPQDACSRIRVVLLDNPGHIDLDDCMAEPLPGPCGDNNRDGFVCYDTTLFHRVEAVLD